MQLPRESYPLLKFKTQSIYLWTAKPEQVDGFPTNEDIISKLAKEHGHTLQLVCVCHNKPVGPVVLICNDTEKHLKKLVILVSGSQNTHIGFSFCRSKHLGSKRSCILVY